MPKFIRIDLMESLPETHPMATPDEALSQFQSYLMNELSNHSISAAVTMVEEGIDKVSFEEKRDLFLATQYDYEKQEWYCTPRDMAKSVLENFHEFLFDCKAKQARRERYLKAKAELEVWGKEFEGSDHA